MAFAAVTVHTIRHGTRPAEELVETLLEAGVETLVDVRRFPGSRRNPQFGQAVLAATLECSDPRGDDDPSSWLARASRLIARR